MTATSSMPTRYVLVPGPVMRPGFGATTRRMSGESALATPGVRSAIRPRPVFCGEPVLGDERGTSRSGATSASANREPRLGSRRAASAIRWPDASGTTSGGRSRSRFASRTASSSAVAVSNDSMHAQRAQGREDQLEIAGGMAAKRVARDAPTRSARARRRRDSPSCPCRRGSDEEPGVVTTWRTLGCQPVGEEETALASRTSPWSASSRQNRNSPALRGSRAWPEAGRLVRGRPERRIRVRRAGSRPLRTPRAAHRSRPAVRRMARPRRALAG